MVKLLCVGLKVNTSVSVQDLNLCHNVIGMEGAMTLKETLIVNNNK